MDLSRLTIDDYYKLMQMGKGFGATDAYGADGSIGPINANAKGVDTGNGNIAAGYVGGQIPDLPIRAGVAGTYYNMPTGQGYAFAPNVTANFGPVSVGGGASITKQGVMPTVNAGVQLPGNVGVSYSRSMPSNMEASNNLMLNVPVGDLQLQAGVGKGDKTPGYQLQGGLTLDKLFGGQLDLQAQYDTQRKAADFLARYAKQF